MKFVLGVVAGATGSVEDGRAFERTRPPGAGPPEHNRRRGSQRTPHCRGNRQGTPTTAVKDVARRVTSTVRAQGSTSG
jgi:hypothetical protein